MCSFCGCEAEPVIEALMADHAWIISRIHRIVSLIDRDDCGDLDLLVPELAEFFAHHAMIEEAGVVAQLVDQEMATGDLQEWADDHHRIGHYLACEGQRSSGGELRSVLTELEQHIRTENETFLPFAMQSLPLACWDRVEAVHQAFLTN